MLINFEGVVPTKFGSMFIEAKVKLRSDPRDEWGADIDFKAWSPLLETPNDEPSFTTNECPESIRRELNDSIMNHLLTSDSINYEH